MNESPVTSPRPHDPSLDQKVALQAAATRLEREFDGLIDDDAIEQLLHSAYDHVADHATIDNFLPLLAERYTREWLHALADQQGSRV
ncbi:three-helix bundle dimerization domain-containing protein [Nocardia brasiliensis]|uniref:three-helix bundle dimerization domain-containing protein n=1 Tax=Nocardia brasiliensis TaxID=37326 RepID=UPI00366F7F16